MNPLDESQDTMHEEAALLALITSPHISPARFWAALRRTGWLPEENEHLNACARCRNYAAQVKSALTAAGAKVLGFRAGAALRRFPLADAAANQGVELLPEQKLCFEGDADLLGSFYQESDRSHWLALAHTKRLAGTLLLVQLTGEEGVVLRRFVMLRTNRPVPTGRLCVQAALADDRSTAVDVEVVESTMTLASDLAALLQDSFDSARRDDPAALADWRTWAAREAVRNGVPEDVAAVLQRIAGDTPAPRSAAECADVPRWGPLTLATVA